MEKQQSCPQKKQRYFNPHIEEIRRNFWDFFLWKIGHYDDPFKGVAPPKGFTYPIPEQIFDETQPSVMWINHSTFLVQVDDIHILTDPIWSARCSPLSFFGPKRRHTPPLQLYQLPRIDYVLISHDHYDHLDKQTIKDLARIYPEIVWVVPCGLKKWFSKLKIDHVIEFKWWESTFLKSPKKSATRLKITAVPSQHFSGRSSFDLNKTLWVGWVINFERVNQEPKSLYFVGDTGYNPYDFKEIGQTWTSFDLSLIPIGSYIPRKFMSSVHIEPNDAVRIHKEVNSKLSIGMHWKTFCLSDEPMNQPPYDLYLALQKEGIDPTSFLALDPGYEINW
jgi:N-acyl-phosphatidylethanolamine-hydrolysing phospholipase D